VDEVEVAPLSEEEQRLLALLDALEEQSLEALEAYARLLVTLNSSLLAGAAGLFALGTRVWALVEAVPVGRWLVVLMLGFWFLSLLASLWSLWPRRVVVPAADLERARKAIEGLLRRKSRGVAVASWAFGLAALAMVAVVVLALWAQGGSDAGGPASARLW